MNKISFNIPVFNEQDNLKILYDKIKKVVDTLGCKYEILFVDDGSRDNSLKILNDLKSLDSNIKIIVFLKNSGQSAAFDAGFKHCSGDIIVTLDADLQNDPDDIPKMLQFLSDYDVVCGYRAKREDDAIKLLVSKIGNFIRNFVTNDNIIDTGCSLKVYKKEFIDKIKLYKGMHRFLPTLLKLEGAKIYQVEVKHHKRKFGQSKYGIKNRLVTFFDLLAVRWMISRHINYKIKEII